VVNKKISKPKSAYTLVELSIVILILAVLMTGGLTITIGSFNKAKKISTQNKINEIYKSLGKFLLENKRLPCPASLELTKNDNSYGVEYGSGSGCGNGAVGSGVYVNPTNPNIFYGMIPAKTLNLPLSMGEDDFGSKISYVIDQRFTNVFQEVISNTDSGFGTTSGVTGIITVKEKPSSISRDITQDAILVIISHGFNKSGAFNANAQNQNPRSSDLDEGENEYNSFDNNFIYNSQNSAVFDDVVLFKTRNQIVQDFDAHYLIACINAGAGFSPNHAYYGQNLYGGNCVFAYKKIPEKYCDKFGNWFEINRCESW
jgi:prepilin-type N-terminal cleavage/methylation domain-containing protein